MEAIQLNDRGARIGESHPKAHFTDEQITRIRDLREDYELTYDQLAYLFQCHRSTIASICQYRTRAQTPFGWKKLEVNENDSQ